MVLMQNGDQIAGGGLPVIHITQAQYDANPSAYDDPNVLVHITDAPSGHLMGADMSYDANMNYNDIGNIATKSLGKVEYKADNKALYPHVVGEYFINKDGEYCRCTSAISVGQTLTKNTNYVVTDVGSELSANTMHLIFEDNREFTPTTADWEYTGISVTIPIHHFFVLSAQSVYAYTPARGALISTSPTSTNSWEVWGKSPDGSSVATVSGFGPITLYIWGKWDAPQLSMVNVYGAYWLVR